MNVHERPSTQRAPLLTLAGLALLGALVLVANPLGPGRREAWPWEAFRPDGPPLPWGVAALWALTGLLAFGSSFFHSLGKRATVLLVLGSGLFAASMLATLTDFELAVRPTQVLACALLGGGLVGSGFVSTGPAARSAAAIGAVLLVLEVALFAVDQPSRPLAGLDVLRSDLTRLGDEGAAFTTGFERGASGSQPYASLLLLGGAAVGLLAAFGVAARWLGLTGFVLVLAGLVLPSLAVPFLAETTTGAMVAEGAATALVDHGGALFLLGAGLVLDLLPRRRTA
jgi:hypothetical protein